MTDAAQATAPVVAPVTVVTPSKPHILVRATTAVSEAIDGLKTLLFFGVSMALGLTQELGGIDVTPVLSMILPEGSKITVAQAIVFMGMAGVLLRLVTKTAAFYQFRKSQGLPIPSGSNAYVDDPDVAK